MAFFIDNEPNLRYYSINAKNGKQFLTLSTYALASKVFAKNAKEVPAMGKMNLLKANWDGKVGETVGAKWKNKKTIRTYTKPSNPNTEAQQTVRNGFKDITSYVALFSDQIKYLSSLDTRGMSVRNAIIKANADMVASGTFTKADLVVNKGGLPNVTAFTVTTPAADAKLTATFTAPAATNITSKAVLVAVAVNAEDKIAAAGSALLSSGSIELDYTFEAGDSVDVFYWIIDYRGSSRVGSLNSYTQAAVA